MDETYWAWVAGIIDGEGSLFVTRVRHPQTKSGWYARIKIGVTNTDLRMLERLALSGGSISGPSVSGRGTRRRPHYRWRAGATWLRANGGSVLPHLVTKSEQMVVALDALGGSQADVYAARQKLQLLNIGADRAAVERDPWI